MEEDDSFPVLPTSPGPADAGDNESEQLEQQSEVNLKHLRSLH